MRILFLVAALSLTACGHEMTKLDRELALKLADRPTVVASAQPVIINVNNGASSPQAQDVKPFSAYQDDRQNCRQSPSYDVNGNITGYEKHCFGGN